MATIQLLIDRGCAVVARTSAAKHDVASELGAEEVSVRGADEIGALDPVDAVVDVDRRGSGAVRAERLHRHTGPAALST